MAEKTNLTEARVKAVVAPKSGRSYLYDSKVSGLLVCASPNGTKSFQLYRRGANGRPTRITLGRHPELTVEHARDLAVKRIAAILDGRDPNAEKKSRRGGMTLGDAFERFMDRTRARGSDRTAVSHQSRFNTCLDDWSERQLTGIHRAEVVALHTRLGDERGHVTANRAIQLLRAIFNHASILVGTELANPASKIEFFREEPRERFLSADELPKFFKALKKESDPNFRDFFALCLWTGARRGNVQAMRWRDLDLNEAIWKISAEQFKTKKSMSAILSPEALEILNRRRKEIGGEWVFPSYGRTGHLTEPKGAWARLIERAGLADLRIHDLRRSLGSWQAALGSSLPIIGKSLGHTRPETTSIYARLDIEPVRQSVNAATAAMAKAAKG
jgi:integrase